MSGFCSLLPALLSAAASTKASTADSNSYVAVIFAGKDLNDLIVQDVEIYSGIVYQCNNNIHKIILCSVKVRINFQMFLFFPFSFQMLKGSASQ